MNCPHISQNFQSCLLLPGQTLRYFERFLQHLGVSAATLVPARDAAISLCLRPYHDQETMVVQSQKSIDGILIHKATQPRTEHSLSKAKIIRVMLYEIKLLSLIHE